MHAQTVLGIGAFAMTPTTFSASLMEWRSVVFSGADSHTSASVALKKAAGAFAFASGMLGYYTFGNLMCREGLDFVFHWATQAIKSSGESKKASKDTRRETLGI